MSDGCTREDEIYVVVFPKQFINVTPKKVRVRNEASRQLVVVNHCQILQLATDQPIIVSNFQKHVK